MKARADEDSRRTLHDQSHAERWRHRTLRDRRRGWSHVLVEAVATVDIDIFISLRPQPGRSIVSIKPILDHLAGKGCSMDGEHVVVAGWPVQFLPAAGPLLGEALDNARDFEIEGETVRVFRAEYLLAIALQTGRRKHKERVVSLLEGGVLDRNAPKSIISRHGLGDKWRQFSHMRG